MKKHLITPDEITKEQHEVLALVNKVKESKRLNNLEETYSNLQSTNQIFTERKIESFSKAEEKVSNFENLFPGDTSISITEPVILYVDGVFDIIHSGHFNAIRQSKKLTDILYVGVNSDEEVFAVKGPTLLNEKERFELVKACKWADKIIPNTPYSSSIKFLDEIGAHYCAHGDDMAIGADGVDAYSEIKKAGRMKIFKRTEGISTTNLLGRIMMCSEQNNSHTQIYKPLASKFLSTGWRLREFCNEKYPQEGDKIIYIDGAWDLLHPSHIQALEEAKKKGDFLYVGVYDDTTCNAVYGYGNPVLGILERVCNLLALKYVDDVVIGSPRIITEELIKNLGVHKIISEENVYMKNENLEKDPYEVAKKLGIYETIKVENGLNNDFYVERFMKNKDTFLKKYEKKSQSEENYEKTKEIVKEI